MYSTKFTFNIIFFAQIYHCTKIDFLVLNCLQVTNCCVIILYHLTDTALVNIYYIHQHRHISERNILMACTCLSLSAPIRVCVVCVVGQDTDG